MAINGETKQIHGRNMSVVKEVLFLLESKL